jgi:hypothetical protein
MKIVTFVALLFFGFSGQLFAQTPTIRINELLASNGSGIRDAFDDRSDWIEIHNNGLSPVNLGGYYLTDSKGSPMKWVFPSFSIPAKSYRIVFASGRDTVSGSEVHTNFALSKGGEFVGLRTPEGVLMDSVSFGPQETDISYGRTASAPNGWVFFETPTPGTANGNAFDGFVEAPQFSHRGGFFATPITLTLTPASPGDQIYYTTDGVEPTSASTLYSGPILIDTNTPLRAISTKPGFVSSAVITHTYLFNEPATLPVISIVTDPDGMFGDQNGIYVTGTNGVRGSCDPTIRNVNRDWERAANIELYETDGQRGLNQVAGIKIMGGCSRTRYPQKSFSLHARGVYGDGKFRYAIFPDRPMDEYETINLRSAADDQVRTLFRDAFTQHLTREFMDSDIGAYRPAVVYINGVYWGIHNMRERQNNHYLAGNYGVDPEKVNLMDNNAVVSDGSNQAFLTLRNYIRDVDMTNPSNYAYVKSKLDVDQFSEYHLANIYTAEEDWPGNNLAFWNAPEDGYDRWRWIQYDRDHSFKTTQLSVNNLEMATMPGGTNWPNPDWSTLILRRLLTNNEFRNRFIQLYAFHLNTTYDPDRVAAILDTFKTRIEAEMPRHITKWGGQRVPDLNDTNQWVPHVFSTIEEWSANVDDIRQFAIQRPNIAISHLEAKFGLNGLSQLTVATDDWTDGTISFLHKPLRADIATGQYFRNVPLTLTAAPRTGRLFSHWVVSVGASQTEEESPSLTLILSADTYVEAVYLIDTSVDDDINTSPFTTALDQNYPNPFNPKTVISYRKSEIGRTRLAVYDLLGREVAVLVDGVMPAGEHSVNFDASTLASGIYIYRLQAGSEVFTKRMSLIK